ncbi:MAG: Na(+)/H(+) antiporter subunit D [Candidatus Rokubacteria bacterium]|nr:Na(+)/H(+) antiporter subunit D [Candidatus Rokubacteria bacterium]
MTEWAHPAWPYLAAALLVAVLPRPIARLVPLAGAALSLALAWTLTAGSEATWSLLGQTLVIARVDALGRVFAVIFALFGGLALVYALDASRRLHVAGCVAAAAGVAISLAGDWITLYAAWELLAVASFVIILDGATAPARAAALRYLLVHATGGALLLAGIAWHVGSGGSVRVGPLAAGGAGVLVLLGFAVNAAIPPLHAWLTDAYPESSPGGSVFLSAFATKSAVYALARVFAGEEILVWAGVTMALYGVVFAMLENDIRRLLGYHIVSQVGYMVTGVGLGTALAVNGAAAHAFSHILYKGLMFMGTGAVLASTGRRRLTDLGGLGAAMPATFALYMVGAFSISGAPLLNGFVSKSLIVAGAGDAHREIVAGLLTLASVGTFLSVGLKLPYYTFLGSARDVARPAPVPLPMVIAMSATAALCVVLGVAPRLLYAMLPHDVAYEPYSAGHVLESLELLVATAVIFLLLRGVVRARAAVTCDADRLYRRAGGLIVGGVAPLVARAAAWMESGVTAAADVRVADDTPRVSARLAYAVLVSVAVLGVGLAVLMVTP